MPSSNDSRGVSAIRAVDFLDGIGVDTHIPYTDGGYVNLSNVQSDLNYLGVREVRDSVSNGENGSAPLSSYIQLAKQGEKFTFFVGGGGATAASVKSTLALIGQINKAVPGSVVAVEGPNEINNFASSFNGVDGLQGTVNLQKFLYQSVKSDPSLSGVAVDYFTGYASGSIATGPSPATTAGLADFDTQHPYPTYGSAPATSVDPTNALPNEPGTKGKFVYTETGYTTNLDDTRGVDPTVQAKYTLDLVMDAAKDGASHTDLYQLLDAYRPGSPQGDDGFGLFDPNNNPKLAAIGLHDLAALLADKGATAATFTPTPLAYGVTGLPASGNSLEIAKSNGTTDIAVWAEPQIWNASTKSEVAAPTETATVSLDGPHAVSVYDPLVGTSPIASYSNTSSVHLQVTDHPLILQVGTAAAAANPPAGGSASVGSGSDHLDLGISEDAYRGDAQYTVSVDGKQVGGTLTAKASHAAGQTDRLTVKGDWGAGTHRFSIDFLNDVWGGTSGTDRNLYVNGASYDGTNVTNASLALHSEGSQHFLFHQ